MSPLMKMVNDIGDIGRVGRRKGGGGVIGILMILSLIHLKIDTAVGGARGRQHHLILMLVALMMRG